MERTELQITKGRLVSVADAMGAEQLSERALLAKSRSVKLVVEDGTTVRWHASFADWSSLYFAKEYIWTLPAPYTLSYYLSGWFSETYADVVEASSRIDQLIAKSDVHLSSRVYIRSFDPTSHIMPEILSHTLKTGQAPPESSVDCSFDFATGQAKVERIGRESAIARLWGLSPVTTPCISGTNYDIEISRSYAEVLQTGKPHYDHVYAAMMGRDAEISWIPYQRLVLPHPSKRGRNRLVTVITEVTPVDIAVV
jgi:hypothetical protein